ncbi:MAG: tRNA (N(6)-L-threonylcarbamoyladenosine(37)-C(2))-methylthiotransferase MtaB [Oscillospiraceae bacterium]|nr:tRNA (N(6)-L-threonylcarbamoyladenosine(37)-C(2))-methylthiotransferase MtaB [Oscillospiraceae bacterium]
MKYIIYTLGCKVNQYETQAMETVLLQRGHAPCGENETAELAIVNTCAVTAEAERKSRQAINRLKEENPDAVIAVSGCYSQLSPDTAQRLGAHVVFGTGDRVKLIDAAEKAFETGEGSKAVDDPFRRRVFEELPAGAAEGRTRALLKIQDGCVNFCTYCIIPYTRGRLRSLPVEEAAKKAAELQTEGFRELVLTGIEIASYGVDLPEKPDLAELICRISRAAPELRLRLGSLEPGVITENFCRRLSEAGTVCRHFHLSLQSGCDTTLKNMNRKYDTSAFFEKTELLRKYFPGCGITCDVIVGFPGETEEHQRQTLDFLKKVSFSDVHIFPYSRRPGTPADRMPGQIDRSVKALRSKQARAVGAETRRAFMDSQVGKELPVLFETKEGELWQGHSDNYIPVRARGENLRGVVRIVKITANTGENLVGTLIDG